MMMASQGSKNQLPIFGKARKSSEQRRGATAVEFAIVAPIFIVLLVTSIEFSKLNVMRHTGDHAAYEAARHAMVPGATSAEAIAKASNLMNAVGTNGATVTITPATILPETEEVTVSVDVPMDQNGWILPKFIGSRTLHSESTLKTERSE